MKIHISVLWLLAMVQALSGQSDQIINTQARNFQNLDGYWDVIIDPFETGYYNHRYEPSRTGYFQDSKIKNEYDLVEYSFEDGQKLNVPGDWNTQDERLFFYEGTIWYRRVFDFNKSESDNRVFLYFGAVNYDSKVYLNGEKIGEHVGGFTPFNIEVTDKIKEGENFLILKVDNKRSGNAVPTVNFDWWNYGGITRSVKLIETPSTFIQDYFIQLAKTNNQKISGWIKLNGKNTGNQEVKIDIPEAKISTTVKTDQNGLAKLEINVRLSLWTPENPKLYAVTIQSAQDGISDRIGFRTIEVEGEDIFLNGESVFLRGICIHEESPLKDGRAYSEEEAKILLGWAKEMNCNFVRLAHYPHNENMTRMADEMGLMLWSEIPVYWTILWNDASVYKNAENQLEEMINRDKNKASIILWSVANETPVSPERIVFLSNLIDRARSIDPTRLITAALDTQTSSKEGKTIDDPLAAEVDVIGINSYCGWYGADLPETCGEMKWASKYNKPMIMSEFGGGALQGYHGNPLERWTEEYQASVYKNNLEMIRNISFLRGTTPWILKDFRSPRRPLPNIQDFWNRKGLISDRGIKKKAFYIMKAFYEEVEENFQ